ncbi:MAG: hypothetical protein ACYTF1_24900, partial [Planctomycetota bacterium]
MTRETKMGLLIGLGVIVIFAILLSHHNPVPPPGDGLELVTGRPEGPPTQIVVVQDRVPESEIGRDYYSDADDGLVDTASEKVEGPSADEQVLVVDLPRPDALEPASDTSGVGSGSENLLLTDASEPAEEPVRVVKVDRVAPPVKPVKKPSPTVQHEPPAQSPAPKSEQSGPPQKVAPPKVYIVCKGDTLGQIVQNLYGSQRGGVLEYF